MATDATNDPHAAFRERARVWFAANVPQGWQEKWGAATREEHVAFQREWLRTLRDAGDAAPHWPKRYGGAERRGDRYVVNGQKLWSSYADLADWCLLLARTDPDAPKRKGISFFLLDMRSPGVETRPLRQITDEVEFCEVFLNDVEIPVEHR